MKKTCLAKKQSMAAFFVDTKHFGVWPNKLINVTMSN
jgi:hypothetical protein